MSALSAAASDEDGDIISALREKLGRAHALCRIRLDRIRELEAMLYAVGAGGVGKMGQPPAVKESLTDGQPQVEQEPVAWAVMKNGEICWDADYPFSNEPGWSDSDQECVPLYTRPQPPVVKQSATVSASAYDRLQTLCDSQAARIIELEQPRQPLTPETVNDLWHKYGRSGAYIHAFAQAIERAHGVGGDA